jgi:hypothetical protein
MCDENSPHVSYRGDDCIGKQCVVRMSVVATAGATDAAGFAATAGATADSGSGEII